MAQGGLGITPTARLRVGGRTQASNRGGVNHLGLGLPLEPQQQSLHFGPGSRLLGLGLGRIGSGSGQILPHWAQGPTQELRFPSGSHLLRGGKLCFAES